MPYGNVNVDGDFDLVADIIEGLEKLPPDFDPSEYEGAPTCAMVIYSQSEDGDKYGSLSFRAEAQADVDSQREYYEGLGFPVVLWTPILPAVEIARYWAALNWGKGEPAWVKRARVRPTLLDNYIPVKQSEVSVYNFRDSRTVEYDRCRHRLLLAKHTEQAYTDGELQPDSWEQIIIGLVVEYRKIYPDQIQTAIQSAFYAECRRVDRESREFIKFIIGFSPVLDSSMYGRIPYMITLLIEEGWLVEEE